MAMTPGQFLKVDPSGTRLVLFTPVPGDVSADPAGAAATVQGNLDTHAALTTAAHGGIVSSSDSRLTDARPASDVYTWAKAATKPSYTYSEVDADPAGAATAITLSSLGGEASVNKGAVGGYCPLDTAQKVPTANLGGAGADNTKYLRGDQTWATPTAAAADTNPSLYIANADVTFPANKSIIFPAEYELMAGFVTELADSAIMEIL